MESPSVLKSRHNVNQLVRSDSEESDLSIRDLQKSISSDVSFDGIDGCGITEEFKGWSGLNRPSNKHTLYASLIEQVEYDLCDSVERVLIDGITFLSFTSDQDLMNFSKHERHMKSSATQSDEGLVIMDDGSSSDVSSGHIIIPQKTNDITKIKGWRKKHFSRTTMCNSSEPSVKVNDDGFGEEGSSGMVSSDCQVSYVSNSNHHEQDHEVSQTIETGVPLESWNDNCNHTDTNNVSTMEKSHPVPSGDIQTSSISKERDFDFSSIVLDKRYLSSKVSSELQNQKSSDEASNTSLEGVFKITHSLQSTSPLKTVYQSRVKPNFLLSIEKKLHGDTNDLSKVNAGASKSNPCSPIRPTNENSRPLCWHVPNESLESGSIYDVKEASSIHEDKTQSPKTKSDTEDPLESLVVSKSAPGLSKNGDMVLPLNNISNRTEAFQSSILDTYTQKTNDLLIEFELPKLDAADNVTHEEDEFIFPSQKDSTPSPLKVVKPLNTIKAKTVAEKRKILEEMSRKETRKTKRLKLETDDEKTLSTRLSEMETTKEMRQIRGLKKKSNSKTKSTKKKEEVKENCFDQYGGISYGKEKPPHSLLTSKLLSISSYEPDYIKKSLSLKDDLGMILNVGLHRPLYKEALENLTSVLNTDGIITESYAEFAVAAVQPDVEKTIVVTRFLVPALNQNLRNIMQVFKPQGEKKSAKLNSTQDIVKESSLLNTKTDTIIPEHMQPSSYPQELNQEIYNIVRDLTKYVEKRDYFDSLTFGYDPSVPIPSEREQQLEQCAPVSKPEKKKKKNSCIREVENLVNTSIIYVEEDLNILHCGKASCMLECSCSNATLQVRNRFSLLPEAKRLQKNLAPVEREFHQTVIMSKNKVTVESHYKKRERKVPSKYKDASCEQEITKIISAGKKITPTKHFTGPEKTKSIIGNDNVDDLQNPTKKQSPRVISNNKITKTYDVKNLSTKHIAGAATKKSTDCSPLFDTDTHSSRNFGVPSYYSDRNLLCKLRLKDKVVLYARKKCQIVFEDESKEDISENPFVCCKDDLDDGTIAENELNHFEDSAPEDGGGLAIDFVCSLPPENFDNLLEESCSISKAPPPFNESASAEETNGSVKNKSERIVCAALPKSENECKWWVVELNGDLFTKLVYSDKQSFTLEHLQTLVNEVERTQKPTIRYALNKPFGSSKDKFGAYAVLGHKHLVFFGPYDLNENHGVSAFLQKKAGHFSLVPFTSVFSSSVSFEALGFTQSKNDKTGSERHARAVWWYKKGKLNGQNQDTSSQDTNLPAKTFNQNDSQSQDTNLPANTFNQNYSQSQDTNLPAKTFNQNDSQSQDTNLPAKTFNQNYSQSQDTNLPAKTFNQNDSQSQDTNLPAKTFNQNDSQSQDTNLPAKTFNQNDSQSLDTNLLAKTFNQNDSQSVDNTPVVSINNEDSACETGSAKPVLEDVNDKCSLTNKQNEKSKPTVLVETPKTNQKDLEKFNLVFSKSLQNMKGETNNLNCKSTLENDHESDQLATRKRKSKRKSLFSDKRAKILTGNKPRCKPAILRRRTAQQSLESLHARLKYRKEEARANKRKRVDNFSDLIPEQGKPKEVQYIEDDTDFSSDDDDDSSDSVSIIETNSSTQEAKNKTSTRFIHKQDTTRSTVTQKQALPGYLIQKTPSQLPCPEHAMICMTEGVGYIPVKHCTFDEIVFEDPTITDDADGIKEHKFFSPQQASEWLEQQLRSRVRCKVNTDMSWRLVKGSLIKHLKPLNPAIFRLSPRHLEITEHGLETTLSELRKLQGDPERLKHACSERMRRRQLKQAFVNLQNEVFNVGQDIGLKHSKIQILENAILMTRIQTQTAVENLAMVSREKDRQRKLNGQIKKMISDIMDFGERQKAIKFCENNQKRPPKPVKPEKSIKFSKYLVAEKEKEFKFMRKEKRRKRENCWSYADESSSQDRASVDSPLNTLDESMDSSSSTIASSSLSRPSSSTIASSSLSGPSSSTKGPASSGSIARPTEGVLRKKVPPKPPPRPTASEKDVILLSDSDASVIELSDSEEEVNWVPVEYDDLEFVSYNSSNNKFHYNRQRALTPPSPVFATSWPELNQNESSSSVKSLDSEVSAGRVSPVALVVSESLFQQHKNEVSSTESVSPSPEKSSRTMPVSSAYKSRDKFQRIDASPRVNIMKGPPSLLASMKMLHGKESGGERPGGKVLSKGFASFSKPSQVGSLTTSAAGVVLKPSMVQRTHSSAERGVKLILPDTTTTSATIPHIPVQRASVVPRFILPTTAKPSPASSGKRVLARNMCFTDKNGVRIKIIGKSPIGSLIKPLPLSATPVSITQGAGATPVTITQGASSVSGASPVWRKVQIPATNVRLQAGPKVRTPRQESSSIKVMLPKKD